MPKKLNKLFTRTERYNTKPKLLWFRKTHQVYWYYLPGWELILKLVMMPKYWLNTAIMYLLPIFMELPIPQKIWNRLKKCRPTTKSIPRSEERRVGKEC